MSDNKRDLVLPPGSYAYMQDVTKGVVKTYSGPTVINPTAQERPVIYDPASNTFRGIAALEDAMRIAPIAAEGYYIILRNPARANKHPDEGSAQPSAELEIGRAIIVPGPATFALWPGQAAEVVEGHHLRSNQYLLVRVYNEDEARRNWSKAVVKPAALDGVAPADPVAAPPPDLTVGKQLIIRGTEVSFYIPPTGIEVVREPGSDYAREALTLERLEYAILVDENGKKRYEVGPQVVFPLPTERFVEARDDAGRPSKKFRAVELNEIQGLHIKVIADYTELLCDHARSVLKGQIRRHTIEDFYAASTDRIRDVVLGASGEGGKRPGMGFAANGMRIVDVDVLRVVLEDDKIRGLLEQAQHDVVRSNIDLSNLARELTVTRQREAISRETAEVKTQTRVRQDELARELAASELATALAKIANALRESDERKKLIDVEHAIDGFKLTARLDRVKREREQELAFFAREQAHQIELLRAQADTAVQRFTAASGSFSEALLALGRNDTLVKVAQAWSVQRLVEGESLGDTLSRLFHNTPLKPLVDKLVLANGDPG